MRLAALKTFQPRLWFFALLFCLTQASFANSPTKPVTNGRRVLIIYNGDVSYDANIAVTGGNGVLNLLTSAGAYAGGLGFNFTVETLNIPSTFNVGQSYATAPSGVTQASLPLTASNYCMILDLRFQAKNKNGGALPGDIAGDTIVQADVNQYANYLATGGGLFILGDNFWDTSCSCESGFISREETMYNMINTVAATGIGPNSDGFEVGPSSGTSVLAAAPPYNLGTYYNTLSGSFTTAYDGALNVANVGSGKVWMTLGGNPNEAMGIVWQGSDLGATYSSGRMMYWADTNGMNSWATGSDPGVTAFIENAVDFLFNDTCCQTPPNLVCGTGPAYYTTPKVKVVDCFSTGEGVDGWTGACTPVWDGTQDADGGGGGSLHSNCGALYSDKSMFSSPTLNSGDLVPYDEICFKIMNTTGSTINFQIWNQSYATQITPAFSVPSQPGWQSFCEPFTGSFGTATQVNFHSMNSGGENGANIWLDSVQLRSSCSSHPMIADNSCCAATTPTNTPLASFTFTPTATPSFTPSSTLTDTPTDTPSATYTATPSATPTFTSSDTPTISPTATNTFHASPTNTATITDTSSATPSNTPSYTATPSDTPSITFSSTPSYTATRTNSPSPTQSFTFTGTQSFTDTNTPSATPTQTYSFSPSPTFTNTPSATPSFTPSDTFSPTASFSASPTPSATPTQSYSFSPSPSFSNTPSATPTFTPSDSFSPTVSFSASPTPSATPTQSYSFSPSPSFSNTPTYTATPTQSFTFTGTQTFSNTATPSASPSSSPTPTPSSTATPSKTASPTPSVTPTITQTYTFTLTPVPVPFQVSVKVYNSAGELVRTLYQGASQILPSDIQVQPLGQGYELVFPGVLQNHSNVVAWNLSDDNGQPVDAGQYYIKLEFKDPYGRVTSMVKGVSVLQPPATQSVDVYNSAGEVVVRIPLPAAYPVIDFNLQQSVYGPQYDAATGQANSSLTINYTDSHNNHYRVTWDGKNSQGQPVSSGVYNLQLEGSTQNAQLAHSLNVISAGWQGGFSATLEQNPVLNGSSVTLDYSPGANASLALAQVYNFNGELVDENADFGHSGRLKLDINKLASGIYLVVFELKQGSTVLQRKVLKMAVEK